MGEAKGVESGELEHIANQMNGYPRDLLKRFTSSSSSSNNHLPEIKIEEETEEIELNLGLSLGGRFGVDPKESKLVRSTSIAGLATATTLFNDGGVPKSVGVSASIFRTTSLPTETEEEWRKRKEMQCLRRMEAKRKRSEKQKNIRAGGVGNKDRGSDRASMEEEKRIDGVLPLPSFMGSSGGGSAPTAMQKQQQQQQQHLNGVALPLGLPPWGKGSVVGSSPNAKASNVLTSSPAGQGLPPPSSQQGSVGSQGSSSTSGISEFESRPAQGFSNCAEARSPVSVQSLPEQNEQKPTISPTSTTKVETGNPVGVETENAAKKPKVMENGMRESGMKVMEEMPCVSAKGDGPDGRRVEGFLYKYKKGEEAVIVCVCHGKFLSPAEFVRHAGGGDVTHPLRHIVVNPSPSFS